MGSDYHNQHSRQNEPERKPEQWQGEQYVEPSYREHVSGPLSYGGQSTAPRPGQQPAASPLAQPAQGQQPVQSAQYAQPAQSGTYIDPRYYQQPAAPQQNGARPGTAYPQANTYAQPGSYPQAGTYPQQGYYNGYYYNGYPYYPSNGYYPGYYQPNAAQPGQGQPQQQQAYQPYPYYPYPYYQYPYGYYGAYPSYYQYAQQRPKGSTYQRAIAVITTIFSSLALLIGLFCALILLLIIFSWNTTGAHTSGLTQSSFFSSITMMTSLTIAGLGGGGFGLYHSIRALMRRKSLEFKLPSIRLRLPVAVSVGASQANAEGAANTKGFKRFIKDGKLQIKIPWFLIFLVLYAGIIVVGLAVRGNAAFAANTGRTVLLISLAGLLPALAVLTLGAWRVHKPGAEHWPTTWRRVTMALVSGATSAILFALILETILELVVASSFHNLNTFQLSDPNAPLPRDFSSILFMIILLSVIAPLVEETCKPLAVITMIGRIGSAAEAFTLGMACGIGFDLVETSSYIGMGYSNWVDVAIERSSAGLLHSFGAGMTALGWYLLTHKDSLPKKRVLIAVGCFLYAILQHATWNGSFLLDYLPDPVGSYLRDGVISIGTYQMPAELIVYAVETVLMLTFFWFVTGRLSSRRRTPREQKPQPQTAPLPERSESPTPGARAPYPQPLS